MSKPIVWHSCYEEGWKGLIVDEAFAHPAKFARGLIRRIYQHLRDEYGVLTGAVVVDPFGGVALGALDAMECGYTWVGVELEERFAELGEQNLAKWRPFHPGASAVLVCGDSRELRRHAGEAGVIVGSPPWACDVDRGESKVAFESVRQAARGRNPEGAGHLGSCAGYSEEGNLGSMKPGSLDAVVSSPPYAEGGIQQGTEHHPERMEGTTSGTGRYDAVVASPPYAESGVGCNSKGVDRRKQWETYRSQGGGMSFEAFDAYQEKRSAGYGSTEGNLASLPAGSVEAACDAVGNCPLCGHPIHLHQNTNGCCFPVRRHEDGLNADGSVQFAGGTERCLCQWLPSCDAVVGSPPFEESNAKQGNQQQGGGKRMDEPGDTFVDSPENLGNAMGTTFWEAAFQIIRECHAILRPGGLAVWVVKSFVRGGAIVDFPGDWRKLCESCGFETVEKVHASLVKVDSHPGLFGKPVVKKKARKSFFRRLHEAKRPDLAIDYEVVLFMRKPTGKEAPR